MEDIIGKQLGSFLVLEKLGRGGMATVFLARQTSVDRNVALKVLPRHLGEDARFVERFEREARVLAQLQHTHILPIYDYGESGGYTYIAMPLIHTGTLARQLTGQPWSPSRAEKVIRQLASALDFAHSKGVIHRDIKPSNVLLDESDDCLLSDFGIAKLYEDTAHLTHTGAIVGTPAYMSPEQGQGLPLDKRSDIYSLGIILYEMVAGRVPFNAETPIATIYQQIHDPPTPPQNYNSTLPTGVDTVIEKALAKDPDERFQTAGELSETLRRVLKDPETADDITLVHPSRPGQPPTRKSNQLPRKMIITAAVLLLLVCSISAVAGAKIVGDQRATQEAQAATELAMLSQTATAIIQPSATSNLATTTSSSESPAEPAVDAQVELSVEEPIEPLAEEPAEPPVEEPVDEPIEPEEETAESPAPLTQDTTTLAFSPLTQERVELAGSGMVQMTLDDQQSYTPAFSYDQRYLFAATEFDDYWRIVMVDTEGNGELQILTQMAANVLHPRPKADGSAALVSSDFEGDYDVYLLDLQNGALFDKLTDAGGDDTYARWLPGETGFIFQSYRDGDLEVYVKRLDGSPAQQLTHNTDALFDGYADISPDGQWVTFQSNRDGNHEIYIMEADGTNVKRMTFDPARDAVPIFSPDGEWIAFESDRGGNYDIWAMRTDGGELFNVTDTSSRDQVAEFSPDGRWLAFQSTRDGDYDIYRVPWPYAIHSTAVTEITWPISPTGTEACHLAAGDTVTVGDNARLWPMPNVLEGTAISTIDFGAQIVVQSDEPVWGPIRRDMDIDGWWWHISGSGGESGWIWQGRIIECAEKDD